MVASSGLDMYFSVQESSSHVGGLVQVRLEDHQACVAGLRMLLPLGTPHARFSIGRSRMPVAELDEILWILDAHLKAGAAVLVYLLQNDSSLHVSDDFDPCFVNKYKIVLYRDHHLPFTRIVGNLSLRSFGPMKQSLTQR